MPTVNGQFTNDANFEIAKGNIAGHTVFEKFGGNSNITSTSTPEDVWNGGGLYTGFPTQSETMEIFSSSALDTALGTGARTVTITKLLDSTGASAPDVTVSLNGLTPVSLGATLYHRASRIEVQTAGTSGSNAGSLTLRHTTTITNIFAVMPATFGRTIIAAYTVPLGFTLFLDRFHVQMARSGGQAGSANITFRVFHPVVDTASHAHLSVEITNSMAFTNNNARITIPERNDMVIRVETVSNNGTIVASDFSGILVKNDFLGKAL